MLISVIIPVYNSEKFLEKCVNSVLNQSHKELDIILVDDGSSDKSGEICDQFAQNDTRVRVIHKKNRGVSVARNSGLEIAAGDYCTFVDSDDYIEPEMYQSMVDIVKQYNCDVVMCDCIKEFRDKTEVYTHDIRAGYYSREQLEKEYFPHLLIMPNVEYPPTISNWLCLYRRGRKQRIVSKDRDENNMAVYDIRYEEGIRFSEDLLFGAELLFNADTFYYMKGQCFYHYCMNEQSATHTFAADKWKDYVALHSRIEEKFSCCINYDFSHQIDLVLLFFVYNAVGDIVSTIQLTDREKIQKCNEILKTDKVKHMFSKLQIRKLPISTKQKLITVMYKYRIGIKVLVLRAKQKLK